MPRLAHRVIQRLVMADDAHQAADLQHQLASFVRGSRNSS
jgi:hypothetical protein